MPPAAHPAQSSRDQRPRGLYWAYDDSRTEVRLGPDGSPRFQAQLLLALLEKPISSLTIFIFQSPVSESKPLASISGRSRFPFGAILPLMGRVDIILFLKQVCSRADLN